MKVLIVEDDPDILDLLRVYFQAKGHEVSTAGDGVEALSTFQSFAPELVLLDIVLPRLDGWSVLEALRAQSMVPIILLTALDETDDVVRGLAMGADDHLSKPFEVRELDARIQAILRRIESAPEAETHLLDAGPIQIDDRAKKVTIGGEPVALSPKEYDLLRLLARDPGRVFSSEEIISELWANSSRATASDVKQYIHLLRNKIDTAGTQRVQNVKGFGYKLVPE